MSISVLQEIPERRGRAAALVFPVGAIVLAALFVILAGVRPRLVDDTFITFQYARNLVEHGVLTWHVDLPPVDGYTSLGHVLMLAAGRAAGLDMVLADTIVNFGAMALILALFARMTAELPAAARLAGMATICLNAGLLFWIGGGLDAVPYVAAFFLAYRLYEKTHETGRFGPAAALGLIALAVMRPEGMLIALALVAHFGLVAALRRRRPAAADLAWLATIPAFVAALTAWRMALYGHPLPNTFYAKESASTLLEIRHGLRYVADWMLNRGGLAILATPLALALGARNGLRALFVLGQLGVVVVEGGDSHPEARFLLPLVPLIALDIAWLCARGGRIAAVGAALALVAAVPSAGRVQHAERGLERTAGGDWPFVTLEDDAVSAIRAGAARQIAAALRPGASVAATDVGVLTYVTGLPTLDGFGLNHAVLATLPKPGDRSVNWGVNRLDVLIDQGAEVAVLWFPEPESRSWRDVAEGRASCDAPRLQVRAQRMSVAPDRFARDFLCASLPSADHPGRWINILVRADAAPTVLRDPSSAELSSCVADFLAACRAD